jgi:hypothetical protein
MAVTSGNLLANLLAILAGVLVRAIPIETGISVHCLLIYILLAEGKSVEYNWEMIAGCGVF